MGSLKKMEQGKCPLCGGELEYHGQVASDDCISYPWKCKKCGAEGIENVNIAFECHSCVKDADGNEVELRKPTHLFWVCWIANDYDGKARMSAMYDSYLTLDEAMGVVEKIKEWVEVVMVWIDETADNEKIGTPYIEPLVDTLGQRRKVAKHDEAGDCGENAKIHA